MSSSNRVTDAEIRAVLDSEFTYTVTEIGRRIWSARGGEGSYDTAVARVHGQPAVPIVTKHHVMRTLKPMIERGEVQSATGTDIPTIGRPYGPTRETYTFYTLTERADAARRAHASYAVQVIAAQMLADDLTARLPDAEVSVDLPQRTRVRVIVDPQQGREIFAHVLASESPR